MIQKSRYCKHELSHICIPLPLYNYTRPGPDGIRPHRMNVKIQQHVGEASRKSNETTCALSYLFRSPVGMPFPKVLKKFVF